MNADRAAGVRFGLEARARAAVLATAGEIRADDVPSAPAWLTGQSPDGPAWREDRYGPGGQRGLGRGPGRGTAGRWGVPLAAAAAVVMAAGVTATLTVNRIHQENPVRAVATAYATPASVAASVPAGKRAPAPYPADLTAALIGLFVPATGAQYSAGAALDGDYQALEAQATAACAAGAGFHLTPATAESIAQRDQDLTRFPDLNAIAKAGTLPAGGLPGGVNLSGDTSFTAMQKCGAAAKELFATMVTAGMTLGDPFLATVSKLQGSAPVLATVPALRACAAKHGWPGDGSGSGSGSGGPIDSFAGFVTWVSAQRDDARGPQASAARRKIDAWWASAFVQCARPTVTVMEKLQLVAQQAYLAAHKEQLAALVAVAHADFAKAAQAARG